MISIESAWDPMPGVLERVTWGQGAPRFVLRHPSGATVQACLNGGHLTAWRDATHVERFFMSRLVRYMPGHPIRGGVPVCFPQFGAGPLAFHGFARVSAWRIVRVEQHDTGAVSLTLGLTDTHATRALWPHAFNLELTATLSAYTLALTLTVTNTDVAPFEFQAMLHTYFSTPNIRQTAVHGLRGCTFIDTLRDNIREVETRDEMRVDAEVDRIYRDIPARITMTDDAIDTRLVLEQHGMSDLVLWNPWVAKASTMSDFSAMDYLYMLCLETGIAVTPRTLAPGESWSGTTTLYAER